MVVKLKRGSRNISKRKTIKSITDYNFKSLWTAEKWQTACLLLDSHISENQICSAFFGQQSKSIKIELCLGLYSKTPLRRIREKQAAAAAPGPWHNMQRVKVNATRTRGVFRALYFISRRPHRHFTASHSHIHTARLLCDAISSVSQTLLIKTRRAVNKAETLQSSGPSIRPPVWKHTAGESRVMKSQRNLADTLISV